MGEFSLKRKSLNAEDKSQVLFEGNYLRLIRHGGWEFSHRINCTGIVVIIAMTQNSNVLLIKQYRPPVGRYCIEFPAGLVNDQGNAQRESLSAAAKRELLEETGYRAKKLTKILEGPVSPGSSRDVMTLFRAEELVKVHNGGGDQTENIEVCEVSVEKINRWLKKCERQGCLVDPKVYAGLYFLERC